MGAIYYVAVVSVFFIGLIGGGLAAFISRRVMFNRQIRIAERKAAKLVADARVESKKVVDEAKLEADKTKTQAEAGYRGNGALNYSAKRTDYPRKWILWSASWTVLSSASVI